MEYTLNLNTKELKKQLEEIRTMKLTIETKALLDFLDTLSRIKFTPTL